MTALEDIDEKWRHWKMESVLLGQMANGWGGRIWIQDLRLEPMPIGGLGMHIQRSRWGWWDERMLVQDLGDQVFNPCPDTPQVYILARNLPPEVSVTYSVKWEEHLSSARAKPFPALILYDWDFDLAACRMNCDSPSVLMIDGKCKRSIYAAVKILFLVKQCLHIVVVF